MTVIRIKPSANVPTIDIGDEINKDLVGWWFGGEGMGTKLTNIANPALFNGALQSGITWGNDWHGRMPMGDGTANSYADLGTAGMVPNSGPFTFMWMETIPTTPGSGLFVVMTIMPTSGTQRFIIYRSDSSAAYAPITVGRGSQTNCPRWPSAPSVASGAGMTRIWVLTGTDISSNSGAAYGLSVDGVFYGAGSGGSGNNTPSLTGNLNYLGASSGNSPFPGGIHNCRLWKRRLANADITRIVSDPFVGLATRRQHRASGARRNLGAMFLAM